MCSLTPVPAGPGHGGCKGVGEAGGEQAGGPPVGHGQRGHEPDTGGGENGGRNGRQWG